MIKIAFFALIGSIAAFSLTSCTSAPKCPSVDLTNPVFEKESCRVRTRNVYVGDLMSPELKNKFQDPTVSVHWIGPTSPNGAVTPGHFAIRTGGDK